MRANRPRKGKKSEIEKAVDYGTNRAVLELGTALMKLRRGKKNKPLPLRGVAQLYFFHAMTMPTKKIFAKYCFEPGADPKAVLYYAMPTLYSMLRINEEAQKTRGVAGIMRAFKRLTEYRRQLETYLTAKGLSEKNAKKCAKELEDLARELDDYIQKK